MAWIWRYRIRMYLSNTVWVSPMLGMVLALIAARALHVAEAALGWEANVQPEAARTVLITLASSMFTLAVFVSSTMLLALQLASAQLTPRAIAFVFRDPVARASSTLFVFTFTFVVAVAARINSSVPLLTTYLTTYSCVLSLVVFFYLIDHVGKALRPSELLRLVATDGAGVIESVYPRRLHAATSTAPTPSGSDNGIPSRTIAASVGGVLVACDVRGIVLLAARHDCLVELLPQIGDFVAAGDPLFRVIGNAMGLHEHELLRRLAIGHERTMAQDPAFAFRVIVDIACKALSPAINDPTTAVLALDQVHRLLRDLGQRHLDEGHIQDSAGHLRFVCRTPDWEDFVHLAVTEIRQFGHESIQVNRRLRAMLVNLAQTLPPDRVVPLRQELSLLHRSAVRFFPDPEDRALAETGDSQGVGGRAAEEEDQ